MRSRETREVSRQINFLIFNSNALEHRRISCFIVHLDITVQLKRSTVTMERSIVDRFECMTSVGSLMEGLEDLLDMRFKTP